jgi:predicted AlkP superfamily pyrophosphatase or phosphodiesterase
MAARLSLVGLMLGLCVACTNSDAGPQTESGEEPVWVASGATYTPPPIDADIEPPSGWLESACDLPREILQRIWRGHYPGRSPELQVVPREPHLFGYFLGQTHSGPWDYVQEVPFVFYGPGFIRNTGEISLDRQVTVADLAPTYAELLGVEAPSDRGRPLDEILVPEADRPGSPRLIVTVVWDGGGINVLDAWPRSWPNLAGLVDRGAAIEGVTVGSSPSVTPAVHTTMGTGTFPDEHGIIGIHQREEDGDLTAPFPGRQADKMVTPTLADTYDLVTGNAALVGMIAFKNWHLGMIGHSSGWPGGDKDIAALIDQQENITINTDVYELPSYLNRVPGLEAVIRNVDLDDGELDSKWMGHEVLDKPAPRRDTPVWSLFQTKLIKKLLQREGFGSDDVTDLFYTNYKQLDEIGHEWNMLYPEMKPSLEYLDGALGDLVDFLDREVGRNRWVLAVTADHGQGPLAEAAHAWPIQRGEMVDDISEHFGVEAEEIIQQALPAGAFVNRAGLRRNGITVEEIADFLITYAIGDNISEGMDVPDQYNNRLDELLFASAFPSDQKRRIMACASR